MPEIDENIERDLWQEMRADRIKEDAEKNRPGKRFETLKDGDYVGRVFIQPGKVSGQDSPNYGRNKYILKFTVTEGEHKGMMAYNHRVLLPSYLANKPPDSETRELEEWRGNVKNYLRQTDIILTKCGVDTSDLDKDRLAKKIGENNSRNPVVNFTMKSGVAYVNFLINPPKSSDVLFTDELPDGDDAPIN